MANKERVKKLVAFLERSERYDQMDINRCAIPIARQHFGKISEKQTADESLDSVIFPWFANYFGVSLAFCEDLYGLHQNRVAIGKLKGLL